MTTVGAAGFLEAWEIRELVGRDDPVILDVGANSGQTTAELLEVMPRATIHAFEPDPRAIAEFRRNIAAPAVHLYECAVGAMNGTVTFHQSSGGEKEHPEYAGTGWDQSGSIRRPHTHLQVWPWVKFERQITVPIVTLDAWAEQQGVTRVDFIWADVQGAESDLILGATRLLRTTRYLYTEYSNDEWYEGQASLPMLQALLPDFDLVRRYPMDALLRNRTYGRQVEEQPLALSAEPARGAYIQDVAYHSAFQPSQAPAVMSFVAGSQGFSAPDATQPFRYLELGCGHGATLNGLAAACPQGEFIGVDFNAGLIGAARASARAAGLSNVRYIEAAFSSLETGDLAGCNYLACNGTYSWLEPIEKLALRRVIDATLGRGGLLYLGYASLGRQAITPMWHVLRRLVPASGQTSLERLRAGIRLLLELRDQGAQFLADHPQLLGVLSTIQGQLAAGDESGLENLAHNALAEAYGTDLVDDIAAVLAPLGLEFCGTADLFLNDADLCVPGGVRAQFDQLATRLQRELLKDFMRSTLVRRDLFIRHAGEQPGTAEAWLEAQAQATLTLPRAAAWQQVTNPGWTTFRYAAPEIEFVFERLTDGATRLRDIAEGCVYSGAELRDAFCKLVACPGIEPCVSPPVCASSALPRRIRPGSAFNQLALQSAGPGTGPVHLASPVLGSCIELPVEEAQLLAGLCARGTQAPGAEGGLPARQWFLAERLPLLLRLGIVTPA